MSAMRGHWDIFCRVVDNFGDIGVCWRLARQLVSEHHLAVSLWVDDLASLQAMSPCLDTSLAQQELQGVEIHRWDENLAVNGVGDVIIEAFACALPASVLHAMAKKTVKPVWVNLEYLSAEDWVDGCHGLASPHPALPLTKYFFFPGFSAATGGLLRETGLPFPIEGKFSGSILEISLFCYETAPVAALIDCLSRSPIPVICHVPPGQPLAAVSRCLGSHGPWQHGQLSLRPLPFLTQDAYDALLRRCAINFVRGEDSFLRAQWAARPFVWQIYRQDDDAHLVKLAAFLGRYGVGLSEQARQALNSMFSAWNTGSGLAEAWETFTAARTELETHAVKWAEFQTHRPDLASALVTFCAAKV